MEMTEARMPANYELGGWKATLDGAIQEQFDISDFRGPQRDEASDIGYKASPAMSRPAHNNPDYTLGKEQFSEYDASHPPTKSATPPYESPQAKRLVPSYHQKARRLRNITRLIPRITRVLSGLVSAYVLGINAEVLKLYQRSRFLERVTYTDATHKATVLLRAWPYRANTWGPYVTIGVAGFSTMIAVIAVADRAWRWWRQRRRKRQEPSKPHRWAEILTVVISLVLIIEWTAVLAIMKLQSRHVDLTAPRSATGADIWTWTCDVVGTKTDSFFGAVARYDRNCKLMTSTFYLTILLVLLEFINATCWLIARKVARSAEGYSTV